MKILYSFQETVNRQVSRAGEITPVLGKFGKCDLLINVNAHEVRSEFPVKFRLKGLQKHSLCRNN